MKEMGHFDVIKIRGVVADLTNQSMVLQKNIQRLNAEITIKEGEVLVLDDALLLQSFGLYKPKYDLANSEGYLKKLEAIQNKQEEIVKAGHAAICEEAWVINQSKAEGARMIKDYLKLILRSFNNECDAGISKVKFNNIDSTEKKIKKAFDVLNKLGARMKMSITHEYLNLKLEELHLTHEYQVKKQEEKEEQKRLREQMREEARLQREIEEAKQSLEKEEKHFIKALREFEVRLSKVTTDAERSVLIEEKRAVEEQLAAISVKKAEVDYREQNTRAGYVYVISNLGAFGENIYKIGVTRRLDPVERVDELGDASVPFEFDIHALVFSDDAPKLENALHKAFHHRRLNLVNHRKEFFSVTLDEISEVIKGNFNKPIELTLAADAAEYRQSKLLREQRA
jgi:hypothetical protein